MADSERDALASALHETAQEPTAAPPAPSPAIREALEAIIATTIDRSPDGLGAWQVAPGHGLAFQGAVAAARSAIAREYDRLGAVLHEPGAPHRYRIECEACGQRGVIQLSVQPETVSATIEILAAEPGLATEWTAGSWERTLMADSERDALARAAVRMREASVSEGTLTLCLAIVRSEMEAAQPSAEPGLDVRALENAWAGHWLDVQRGPRPLRLFHTCGPSCSAGLARHYAAALTPDRPTPGAGGETGLQCLCGTDAALAAGETIYARLDIVCPKHDQGFGRL